MHETPKPLIFLDPFPRTEDMVFTPETQDALGKLGRVVAHFGSRAPDELVESVLPEVNIIVGQTAMPADRLDRAPGLRAILNVKANWEPTIDYEAARARGIHVLSAAPAMAPAVAEAALGFAIALGRGVISGDREFRTGSERYGIAGNGDVVSLHNASVGLIGFGNLGRALVPLLKPFSCDISAFDPWLSPRYLDRHGVRAVSLEDVLAGNQFLFILAGATTENEGFLGRERLRWIKRGACVVLISRAEVVEFGPFLEMAQAGRFRAAVDVYPEEPVPADADFRAFDKIVFSAHRAGGTEDSYRRIREAMVEDIEQILAGHTPLAMQRAEPRQAAISRSR